MSAASVQTTYNFSGACIDCAGNVTATLTLANYTPGTALSNSHFVSFSYSGSNLLNAYTISVALGNFEALSGSIPAGLPAPANVSILGVPYYFDAFADGTWDTGVSLISFDFGNQGQFSTPTAGVPEPSTALLFGSAGLAALAWRRRRRS